MSDWTTLYGDALTGQMRHLADTLDPPDEEVEHALYRAIEEIERLRRRESYLLARAKQWDAFVR